MYSAVPGLAALSLVVTLLVDGAMLQQALTQGSDVELLCPSFPLNSHCRNENAASLIIRVRTDVALALHQRQPHTALSKELLQTVKKLDLVLKPLHPGTEDPRLISYFVVKVPDPTTAERVRDRLQHCQAIEAAYIKPPDEMP